MKKIETPLAPAAIGPYAQAIEANGFLFLSGQIPLDPNTQELIGMPDDIAAQTQRVLENIRGILASQNLPLSAIIKTTIFLTNLENFPMVNAIYADFFQGHTPARSTVQVAALPRGVCIEIEAIALTQPHLL